MRERAQKTHEEGGDEVLASDVPEHVSFSKSQVAHGTQTNPEGIVDDPQLSMQLFLTVNIRTLRRKFVRALVSDNS
jgi:hypothetical protein